MDDRHKWEYRGWTITLSATGGSVYCEQGDCCTRIDHEDYKSDWVAVMEAVKRIIDRRERLKDEARIAWDAVAEARRTLDEEDTDGR